MEDPPVAPPQAAAPPVTRTDPDVLDVLEQDPTSFSFFQAVRLIERENRHRAPFGHFGSAVETVRFSARASIAFPPSEIHALDSSGSGTSRIEINAFGVIVPMGTLPL